MRRSQPPPRRSSGPAATGFAPMHVDAALRAVRLRRLLLAMTLVVLALVVRLLALQGLPHLRLDVVDAVGALVGWHGEPPWLVRRQSTVARERPPSRGLSRARHAAREALDSAL